MLNGGNLSTCLAKTKHKQIINFAALLSNEQILLDSIAEQLLKIDKILTPLLQRLKTLTEKKLPKRRDGSSRFWSKR
jgi:hypothetical protein